MLNFISTAKSEGATILTGGNRPEVWLYTLLLCMFGFVFLHLWWEIIYFFQIRWQHLNKGYYVEPTIITDVTTSMQIWREEVFGPVLSVKTFSTEEEAIDLANDTQWVDILDCTFGSQVLHLCDFPIAPIESQVSQMLQ